MKMTDATPRAALLVESMRDVGYSLPSALADIVDNSIAAGASMVRILADPQARFIAIADNGRGMPRDELLEVMRPGSRGRPLEEGHVDLGRFGLGLKSASFSQCRTLTVVSRHQGVVSAARWDLDFVIKEDKWLLQLPDDTDSLPGVAELVGDGTVVVWERLDRIGSEPNSESLPREFTESIDEALEHLELVFHRYLAGEKGLTKLALEINGTPLKHHDPFHVSHRLTMKSPEEIIERNDHRVRLQAYTLAHHKLLSREEWEYQGGSAGHLKNQGFYLYREGRLIIHGTWFGLMKLSELTKLTRVRIDIDNRQDSEWRVDIKKASAHPPPHVRGRLKNLIDTIALPSRRTYIKRGKKLADVSKLPVWQRLQANGGISYAINPEHPMVSALAAMLEVGGREHLTGLLTLIASSLPIEMLFPDLSEDPLAMALGDIDRDTLTFIVTTTARQLLEANMTLAQVRTAMQTSEPFSSHWELVEEVLADCADVSNG